MKRKLALTILTVVYLGLVGCASHKAGYIPTISPPNGEQFVMMKASTMEVIDRLDRTGRFSQGMGKEELDKVRQAVTDTIRNTVRIKKNGTQKKLLFIIEKAQPDFHAPRSAELRKIPFLGFFFLSQNDFRYEMTIEGRMEIEDPDTGVIEQGNFSAVGAYTGRYVTYADITEGFSQATNSALINLQQELCQQCQRYFRKHIVLGELP